MVEIGEPKRQITIEPFPETAPQEEPRPTTTPPVPAPVAPSAPTSPEPAEPPTPQKEPVPA